MKLKVVRSGGQTGVDQAALSCARSLGLETGGWVPKGCRTDTGPAPWLVTYFGCREHNSSSYPPRTRLNVRENDVTVWFGLMTTAGYRCTQRACVAANKPFVVNPTPAEFLELANSYESMNVAGNRYRTNPHATEAVYEAFATLNGGLVL